MKDIKEQYWKDVRRHLHLPRTQRDALLRDLEEIFCSAQEHGESEEAVLARLGPARAYARRVAEPFWPSMRRRRRLQLAGLLALCLAALAGIAGAAAAFSHRVPASAIGQADSMTSIQVQSALPMDGALLLLLVGIAALLGGIVLGIHLVRSR